MAAPPEMNTTNISGTYVMNKALSDPTDKILELQGMGWLMRRMIGLATVTLHTKHDRDSNGVEFIDIKQTLTGGLEGTQENRILDWAERPHEDKIFGKSVGRNRKVKISEIDNEFMKQGWLLDSTEHGLIQSHYVSKKWTADQIWGFKEIHGEKRFARNVTLTAGKETLSAELYYDYVGKLVE